MKFDLRLYGPKRPFDGRPVLRFEAGGVSLGAGKVTVTRNVIIDVVDWFVSGELPFADFE